MTHRLYRGLWILVPLCLLGCYHPPKENQLVQTFEAHRAGFDTLLAMATADKGFRRIPAEGLPPKGLPEARFNEYLAVFRELRIENGLDWGLTSSSDTLFVIASSEIPFGGKNRSEGYAYSPLVPTPLVKNLDVPNLPINLNKGSGERFVFRQLQDHWYLFYSESW